MADQHAQHQAHLQQPQQTQTQQQLPTPPDVQFVNVLRSLGEQVAGLSTTVGDQGVAQIIPSFDGDSKF